MMNKSEFPVDCKVEGFRSRLQDLKVYDHLLFVGGCADGQYLKAARNAAFTSVAVRQNILI